jgi:NADP-dependent 3-hydroxy acid dehydrogenase YdfG
LPDYDVITVGRSSTATAQGDLLDPDFCNHLVDQYTPDLFINNAALLSKDLNLMMKMNGVVAVDLLMRFYQKMSTGTIINISSISAYKSNLAKESDARIAYATAKKYLRDTSVALSASKNKDVKVMCLSPGATHTTMLKDITLYEPMPEHYTNYDWENSICWLRPQEVAETVRWMIDLPPWATVAELVLDNHYSQAINW